MEVRHGHPAPGRLRRGGTAWLGAADEGRRAGRRLLALAAVHDGATRTEAARIGGVTPQIVRDWVLRFNARGPDGLIDRKPPGRQSRLNGAHRAALAAVIESGPIPAVHGGVSRGWGDRGGISMSLIGGVFTDRGIVDGVGFAVGRERG